MKHNKDGILLNGMYFLWENGYFNSGINDILKSCQIPKGSFYHLFETKEDFCVEVLNLYGNILHTSMSEYLSDKQYTPFDRLRNFYLNQIEICFEHNLIKGCLICNLSLELGAISKKIRKELTFQIQTNLHLIEKCIIEAETKSMLNIDISPLQAANFIQNNWFGALLKSKASGKTDAVNDFLVTTFEIIEEKE
jgi:TetR/AcrR family transcriptional regulator, transcriptional repressor for nem operon